MTTESPDATPMDDGRAQQDADLSQLEFTAASEDYQPANDPAMADATEAAPEMATGEMVASLLHIGFGLVASRRGQHWALNEAEAQETGNAIGAVLDKYFPDLAGQGVEVTAVMTCAMVLTPRLMQDKAINAEAEQRAALEKRQAGSEDTGPAPQPNGEARDEGVSLDGD